MSRRVDWGKFRPLIAHLGIWLLPFAPCGTSTAAPASRWGLDVGAQWGRFAHTSVAVADFPDAPYRVSTFTGGVHHERRVNSRLALGTSLRYDEWASGQQLTLFPFSSLPSATVELEFQELMLAPSARLALGRGFGVSLGPEFAYVLRTTSREALGVSPAAAVPPRRSQGTIFEQVGTFGSREVTSEYRRWLLGFGSGVSWEHSFLGHGVRLSAEYHGMLQDPSRRGLRHELSAWRAGLVVFQ